MKDNVDSIEEKTNYLDLANVVSCISVVILHCNGCFWEFGKERYWVTANAIESFFYFAICVFLMISGATLIDFSKRYTMKEYYKKRLKKAFIPFIFWSFFGHIILVFLGDRTLFCYPFFEFATKLFNGRLVNVYWFFIPLFICYLVIPVFSYIPDNNRINVVSFYLRVLLMFVFFVFIINVLSFTINNMVFLKLDEINLLYIIYILFGVYIDKTQITKKQKSIVYFLGIIGLMLHLSGTFFYSYKYGRIITLFKGYTNLPCVLWSVAVFLFLKEKFNLLSKNKKILLFIKYIRKHTFSIYLLHYYVQRLFLIVFRINHHSIYYRVFGFIPILIICLMLSKIIKSNKYLRFILP